MIEIEIENPPEITDYEYDYWHINNSCLESKDLQFPEFFNNFMVKNLPCLIRNIAADWECTKNWVENDQINYDFIKDEYGELSAPVSDCNNIEYNSHTKMDMKVCDYLAYLSNKQKEKILYLKDWHLRRIRPNDNFYSVPSFFALDWLNEFANDNNADDFMFVYIGPKDSWTPLHEDVYCSYSWSVNIVGRKKWILFPPGEEMKLKDKFGNLPIVFEAENYEDVKYFEIIQEKGDAIYVPSGWHHQVVNELNTISINHNWINACNVHIVWKALQNSLQMVEHQIEEFKDTTDFVTECQLILKSLFGMDFRTFLNFLCHIASKRLNQSHGESRMGFNKYTLGIKLIKYDLQHILKVMNSIYTHPVFLNTNVVPSTEFTKFMDIKKEIEQIVSI